MKSAMKTEAIAYLIDHGLRREMCERHVIEHHLPPICCWIDFNLRYHQDIGIAIDFTLVPPPPGVEVHIEAIGIYTIRRIAP